MADDFRREVVAMIHLGHRVHGASIPKTAAVGLPSVDLTAPDQTISRSS